MSTKNLSLLLILCSTLFFLSCKKNNIDAVVLPIDNTHDFSIPAASPVTGKITGIVVDENNSPVPNADVVVSGTTYQTDTRGFFQTANVQLDKYVTTVTVSKAGYFKALRSFSATAATNYLSIKLIPKNLSGTVDAVAGGSVSLSNGTEISLPSNGIIVKSTGVAYSGPVKVYASYIDPTASDFAATVPGSMMGKDSSKMYVLQSTGMIAVDLESPGGQSLQLATGKTASVKMPIPSSLLSKAPTSINTWSLDAQGVWVKEGTATRSGDHYDMQVSHFSFWNCDVPASAIYLTIHVTDQNNNPLPNTWVQLTIPNSSTWWATTHGITNSSGTVAGLVPANLGLVMSISPNVFSCSTPFITQNIGPFSSDTTINITVTVNPGQTITLTGTLNDCNGQPVVSGLASIIFGGYNYYTAPVVNGSYSITVPFCTASTSATIWLVDSTNNAAAGPVTVSIGAANPVVVPTQTACASTQPGHYFLNGCWLNGTYSVGVPLNSTNYYSVIVNVQSLGHYALSTSPINGIQFSDSGTFTHLDMDTLILQGSGTPINTGHFTLSLSTGTQMCGSVLFTGTNSPQAVYSIGGPGGCPGAVVSGNYVMNNPLNASNTVTIIANVTTPGAYQITTNVAGNGPANGMIFSDAGVFTTAGSQTVTLKGMGAPLSASTATFGTIGNGVAGCSFDITSQNNTQAVYTFAGAPGNCTGTTVGGSYQTGIPLIGPNTASLVVNVTTPGYYSINTNAANGFNFSASGVFSVTGTQFVLLTAAGVPQAPGVNTFIPNASGLTIQGCAFTVTTQ